MLQESECVQAASQELTRHRQTMCGDRRRNADHL